MKKAPALTVAAVLLAATMAPVAQAAQPWPSQPIRLIVPYPPGGSVDNLARLLAPALGKRLGQTIVIENKAGASGTIGVDATVRAEPDGNTFGFGVPGAITGLPHVMKVPYNVSTIQYVSLVARIPQVVMVNPSLPDTTLAAFVASAKQHPGKYNYGSAGNVTTPHLGGELLKQQTGIDIMHVPYKGAAPAVTALLSNEVQMFPGDASAALGFIKAGKLRALAVASPERFEGLPDVPTTREAGFPGVIVESNYGIIAPTGTPKDIVDKMAAAIAQSLAEPELRQKMIDQGAIPAASTPDQYRTLMETESKKWGDVIRRGKLGLE
ncbi:tripartite tricarboxylate transporter substrate binding protein [Achromobacter sp. LC458]|uniref:Bug family tripartite tricarboxylate transporter substrate binding protein n=1 Tax=unclassified Achromobacter TaxID=2626865 RepID=UPI00062A223D|nr:MULTISPECIES: tripartite tricarboxylate transporter substrate binding protein [unclassified Achromobacter]AYD66721.1 tripartite tricarboxylate transporter substrate binding protein [Achromobacter sp. B7]MDX3988419.1 tripartite tricarboxylate transporter substrate binding protein [Achromobacter sp.]QYJ20959.1 tripartite tricarboxylate transporter substrate binding protein [Achromobacter sp. ES-001]TRM49590.1 tripartite tricarboxylate transporter substrate binding protein [Achromobacter sp. LC